jgi:hypothetical protein
MSNEPVAWMSNGKEFYVQKNHCPDFIPLYTHPAKTLTDEEILREAYYILMREQQRKAQEK